MFVFLEINLLIIHWNNDWVIYFEKSVYRTHRVYTEDKTCLYET